jgi:hypothetical protein
LHAFLQQVAEGARLARDLYNLLDAESAALRRAGPARDPQGASWLTRLEASQPILVWGRVVDGLPHLNAYRVSSGPGSFVWCRLLAATGVGPFGARAAHTVPPGSYVYYAFHPESFWGDILAVAPTSVMADGPFRADDVFPGSRAGVKVEPCHRLTLAQPDSGGAVNWAAGRPVDQTTAGEVCWVSATGLRIYLDDYMAQLAADESCGLYVFGPDQLARLAAYNLQLRTCLGEREDLDDEGEGHGVWGSSPYPWERLGAFIQGSAVSRAYTTAQVQNDNLQGSPWYAELEPATDDQQPFDRLAAFSGYLGQGGQRFVCLPPPGGPAVNRIGSTPTIPGVFEEHLALSGGYALRTARSYLVAKRPCIPVPRRVRRPEDPLGDGAASTYRGAGLAAYAPAGEPHVLHASVDASTATGTLRPLVRAAGVLDEAARCFNWEGVHPYFYHHLDWYLPEEGDVSSPITEDQVPPFFGGLASAQYLLPPSPVTIPVDHRHSADYYPNESYFSLLEDGGVVIGDGYGAELRMTGGSIFLSAPGDVWVQPGKNFNVWAGWDACIKAWNSADITASRKDVRLKAEHNCMILAGNDQCGGVIVESRAKCPAYDFSGGKLGEDVVTTGIVLKAVDAQVVGLASAVVLRSGVDPAAPGDIILDATSNRIKSLAAYQERYAENSLLDFFTTGGVAQKANEFSSAGASITTSLRVGGALQVDSCAWINGWLSITNGDVASDRATTDHNQILSMSSSAQSQASSQRAASAARDTYLTGTAAPTEKTRTDSDRLASQFCEFSLRITSQYRTTNLALFESRWQQLARLGAGVPATWSESPVTQAAGTPTYPHPGKDAWLASGWYTQDLSLYSVAAGHSLSRSANQAAYETPVHPVPTAQTFEANYPTIMVS